MTQARVARPDFDGTPAAGTSDGPGNVIAQWYGGAEAVRCLSENLDPLVSACPDATVFNTREWLLPAAEYLLAGRELMVLTIHERGDLVGMAPLTWGTEWLAGIRVRTLRYLGYPYSDRIGMLVSPASTSGFDGLVDGMLACPEPWDLIMLDEVLGSDVDRFTQYVSRRTPGMKTRVRHCARSPILQVAGAGDAVEQRYPSSLRTRLRRARKKQVASGKVEIRCVRGAVEDCDALVAAIAEIEGISWKGDEGVGVFTPGQRRDFFSEVTRGLFARDRLDLWLMHLDAKLIAYRWQPRFGGAVLDYNFAHLPDVGALSPGRVLLDEAVQAAARDPDLDRVDASRGSITRPHLLSDWTTECLDQYALWLANATARGALMHFLAVRVNPWVKRLRRRERPSVARLRHKDASDAGARRDRHERSAKRPMKRTNLTRVAKNLLHRAGVIHLARSFPGRSAPVVRMLSYHSVGPASADYCTPEIRVTPDEFERQLAYLTRHYQVISLDEAIASVDAGRAVPGNAVVITFDDGYLDNRTYALPILLKYRATATFFVVSAAVTGREAFWVGQLQRTFMTAPDLRPVLREFDLPEGDYRDSAGGTPAGGGSGLHASEPRKSRGTVRNSGPRIRSAGCRSARLGFTQLHAHTRKHSRYVRCRDDHRFAHGNASHPHQSR